VVLVCAVDFLIAGFFVILANMGYEVTATRRRPKSFDEMSGQDFVVATLKSSVESGRIAHAYLFSGPRGCGKTSAARIMAKSLNCEKGATASPCGLCSSCQEIARGSSMDVIEIDGASNTSVNDVRQIKDEVLFPPNSSRYKVYIIDEVHMLSNSAFNALLKTIEEPPPWIIFIFATTELHKVPATIKSRCQQFSFKLFTIDKIKELLAKACEDLQIQAEDEALFWIAKEATGSLRDAYTLFDQVVSFSDGVLSAELIREKLGLVGLDSVNALAELCAKEACGEALLLIDEILTRGVSVERCIIDLTEYYRSLLLLKNGIDREALLGYSPDRFSSLVLETLDSSRLEKALSLLLECYRDVRYSVSPRFELENCISKLCWLGQWVSTRELRDAVNGVRGSVLPGLNSPLPVSSTNTEAPRTVPEYARAPESPTSTPVSTEPAIDMSQPGAFTESFKRMLEKKHASQTNNDITVLSEDSSSKKEEANPEQADEASQQQGSQDNETILSEEAEKQTESIIEEDPSTDTLYAPEDLKDLIIKALKRDRSMLASNLEKTGTWIIEDSILIIPARDNLAAELLGKDQQFISAELRRLNAQTSSIKILVPEPSTSTTHKNTNTALPSAVENVMGLFKGTLVRGVS
jgi:DNA polymerase III subunit gamma/tau